MTPPLTWPECVALADKFPTSAEARHGAGQASISESAPSASRPRGIRGRWHAAWERMPFWLAALIAVPAALCGWAGLNLLDCLIRGLVFAHAGLSS